MVTLLHCADLHLAKSRTFPNYLERQATMLDAIFQTAKEKTDGLVLIVGDVYDNAVLYPREKDLFIEKLSEADRDGLTTIVINGNHDLIDQNDDGYTHLRTIKNLVQSKRLKNTICVETDPQALYLDQFKLGLVCLPALYRKTKEVNAIVASLTRKLHKEHGEELPVVAAVHETIIGSVSEAGFPFTKGVKLQANLPVLYWALGDIHGMQKIPGVNAWYSGCPIQHDFSDSPNRGVLIVDLENPTVPEFYKLHHKVPQLVTVTLPEGQDPNTIEIPKGAIVKVLGSRQQLAETYFPDNVVKTDILKRVKPESQAIQSASLDDLYSGLVEILAEAGMEEEGQQFCIEFAEKLR